MIFIDLAISSCAGRYYEQADEGFLMAKLQSRDLARNNCYPKSL